MGKRQYYILLPVLIFSAFVFSVPCPVHGLSLNARVHEYKLKNGLTVLLMERHQSPTVALYMRFKVGSVDEARGKSGTAHLLEHMLFKGTKSLGTKDYYRERALLARIDEIGEMLDREQKRGAAADKEKSAALRRDLARLQDEHKKFVIKDEIDTIYSRNGAVGFNASTGNDITTYEVSLPANRIEIWARIESDRFLNPVFREYYSERDVVMEELRQSYETNPERIFMSQFFAAAFTAHPYRVPIIGWKTDLQTLSKKETYAFFKSYYAPNNAIIAIVGDIKIDDTLQLIETYFGNIPPQPIPEHVITAEPDQMGEKSIDVVFDAEPRLLIGFHKPTVPAFDDYVFDIIDALLSSGRTSRLYQSLIVRDKIATSISTENGLPGARYPNLFVIEALPRAPHTCTEAASAIYKEIERLKDKPVSHYELQKVKNQLQASFIRGLESNAGLASQLSYFKIISGDWRYLEKHGEIIDKITPSDIQAVAKKYLTAENRTAARLVRPSTNQSSKENRHD